MSEPFTQVADSARLSAVRRSGLLDSPVEESFDRLTTMAAQLLRTPIAAITVVEDKRQYLKSCVGLREPDEINRDIPLTMSFCPHVVESGKPMMVEDAREHPLLQHNAAVTNHGLLAYLGFPLRDADGHILGTFCVIDTEPRSWTLHDMELLDQLTASARSELMLRHLAAAERDAREDAERGIRRLQLLAEASKLLAESLDYGKTFETIAQLTIPELADWCVIDVLDEWGAIRRQTIAHDNPDYIEPVRLLMERYAPQLDAPAGIGYVMRTAKTQVAEVMEPSALRAMTRSDQHYNLLVGMGLASAVFTPLIARDKVLGVMTLCSTTAGRYSADDVSFLEDLASRIALAVDNANLYQQADRVARTLQASLLPPILPQVPGVELAVRYQPSGVGNEVGGDFYDLFEAGAGRWFAAVGDVCGKGARAAGVSGLARHTLRAAAVQHDQPCGILGVLNEVLRSEGESQGEADDVFATVVCCSLEPHEGGLRIGICAGGHPPPLVRRAAGEVETVSVGGTALGLLADANLSDAKVELSQGDALVLYTDGVTEARDASGRFLGDDGLAVLLGALEEGTVADLATRVCDAALERQAGRPRDDIALLILRVG